MYKGGMHGYITETKLCHALHQSAIWDAAPGLFGSSWPALQKKRSTRATSQHDTHLCEECRMSVRLRLALLGLLHLGQLLGLGNVQHLKTALEPRVSWG